MFSFSKAKLGLIVLLFMTLIPLMGSSLTDRYWRLDEGQLLPMSRSQIADNAGVIPPLMSGDLDGDNQPECLVSEEDSRKITDCKGEILWQSPPDWRVTEAQIADTNHDGKNEAVLVVWRAFQPWPADRFMPYGGRIENHQNHEGQSCQIILVGWQKGAYREVWAGSALANPVSSIQIADLDGDGLMELAALENDYDSNQKGGHLTIWRWMGFVFTLLDRSESRWERLAIMGDGVDHWLATR